MQLRRQFIYTEDQAGLTGFLPLWIPRSANYSVLNDARAFMHDVLEHAMCDKGTIADEMTAYGRLVTLRAPLETSRVSLATELGMELAGMFTTIRESSNKPVRSKALPRCMHRLSRQKLHNKETSLVINEMADSFAGFLEDYRGLEHFQFNDQDDAAEYARAWFTLGHFDALRRYGDLPTVETIGHSVFGSEDFLTNMNGELSEIKEFAMDGDVMTMTLDISEEYVPKVRMRLHPDQYAGWIRQARYNWTNS